MIPGVGCRCDDLRCDDAGVTAPKAHAALVTLVVDPALLQHQHERAVEQSGYSQRDVANKRNMRLRRSPRSVGPGAQGEGPRAKIHCFY